MFCRRTFSLLDVCLHSCPSLSLFHWWKELHGVFLFLLISKQLQAIRPDFLPSFLQNDPSLCVKGSTLTKQDTIRFLYPFGTAHSTKQPRNNKNEDFSFSGRKCLQVGICYRFCRQNGVVVADLAAVDYHRKIVSIHHIGKRQNPRKTLEQCWQAAFHLLGQEVTVRSGVGQQLLFIQSLCIIQSLLGGISQESIRLPLQQGQIKEFWRFFFFLFVYHRLHDCGLSQNLFS